MIAAKYFLYDGIFSGDYGLEIADFNVQNVEENEIYTPTLSVLKVPHSVRFFHGGISYDSPQQIEFSVVSQRELGSIARAHILSHLMGRNEFKKLTFMMSSTAEYSYNAVFTSASLIYVNGICHGIRLVASLDSQFARHSTPVRQIAFADGFQTQGSVKTQTIIVRNMSQLGDEYTYPTVEFYGPAITIYNETDDPNHNRPFTFDGIQSDERITVDNETKIITTDASGVGTRLNNFTSRHWLRMRYKENSVRIEIPSTATPHDVVITCPSYCMIGF